MKNQIGWIICEADSTEMDTTKIISTTNNRHMVEGCIQDMNIENRNGRFYSAEDLVPQLTAPRTVELLSSGNMFGEAGHPTSKDLSRQQTVDPTNLSHLFHKLWVDGDKVMSHLTAANTRVGDDFNRLVESGTKVSFSLRALGSVVKTRKGSEVKNLKVITWDWVIYPSHKAAYMDKILSLNEQCIGRGNNLIMQESSSGMMVPINKEIVTSYVKQESANLNSTIESLEFLYKDITLNESATIMTLEGYNGDKLCVNLESHIRNELMNYCSTIKSKLF